jgi:hypothetical protein
LSSSNSENQHYNKLMDKIVKLQQDQTNLLQEELSLLRTQLAQTNELLSQLINVSISGSTIAAGKKVVPFQTGSVPVGQLNDKPANPDDYPTAIDVYAINSRMIPHMTLVNDGPGGLFFIAAYAKNEFSMAEGHLNVNDQRELFNVYEVRLRADLPLTTFRLIEGIFRTGSFAPQTRANVENRPTLQANESIIDLSIVLDNITDPTINITSPTTQTLTADFTLSNPPLPPGATCTFFNASDLSPMPFNIPEGFIAEIYAVQSGFSTDHSFRSYVQIFPGLYTQFTVYPCTPGGLPFNNQNNLSLLNTLALDTHGAPPGGRNVLVTITNDDPSKNMTGTVDLFMILKRMV